MTKSISDTVKNELGFFIQIVDGRAVVIYTDGFQKPASPCEMTLWDALMRARQLLDWIGGAGE